MKPPRSQSDEPTKSFREDLVRPHVKGLVESAGISMMARCNAREAQGLNVYRLALGQSPFPALPRMVDVLRDHAAEKGYQPTQGLPELRKSVASYLKRRNDLNFESDQIVIGPGTKELLFLLHVVFSGELIVPTPAWVAFEPQARILGHSIVTLPSSLQRSHMLDVKHLELLAKQSPETPRMLVLNYPNNPTGLTFSDAELQEIAAIARKNRWVIFSDEIYSELHHKGQHTSIASFYPEGTIVSTGLSKWLGAGGWRLGAFAFPDQLRALREAMVAVASETFTSTATPIQYAAVAGFEESDELNKYIITSRRMLAALGRYVSRKFVREGFVCPQPEGGFYMYLNLSSRAAELAKRGIVSSRILAERLLEDTGVATLPGEAFGGPSSELLLRIAYVDFEGAAAMSAVEVVPKEQPLDETFLRRYAGRVIEASERIIEWSGR